MIQSQIRSTSIQEEDVVTQKTAPNTDHLFLVLHPGRSCSYKTTVRAASYRGIYYQLQFHHQIVRNCILENGHGARARADCSYHGFTAHVQPAYLHHYYLQDLLEKSEDDPHDCFTQVVFDLLLLHDVMDTVLYCT